MSRVVYRELSGDLSDAEFARRFAESVPALLADAHRVFVESYGGAWLEVGTMTDTKLSIFPVGPTDIEKAWFFRGDTRKRGQSGVMWQLGDIDALRIVRKRATVMAKS